MVVEGIASEYLQQCHMHTNICTYYISSHFLINQSRTWVRSSTCMDDPPAERITSLELSSEATKEAALGAGEGTPVWPKEGWSAAAAVAAAFPAAGGGSMAV